jgi:hypothetical protein
MNHAVLQACLPWLAMLVVLVAAAALLLRLIGSRLRLSRLVTLHADQDGGSQTLSFVMTLPVFMFFMVLIVQVSQLMIGIVLIQYAAFAAARTAIVWIPAQIYAASGYGGESENCVNGTFTADSNASPPNVLPNMPTFANADAGPGPSQGGMTYIVPTDSASCASSYKLNKILSAAILASLPISPSDNKGFSVPTGTTIDPGLLAEAFSTMTNASSSSTPSTGAIANRLQQKLAWAANNTTIELRFYHPNGLDINGKFPSGNLDPPLSVEFPDAVPLYPSGSPATTPPGVEQPYSPETAWDYQSNEIGWQDAITVTVHYNLPLLPLAGRLMKGMSVFGSSGSDAVMGAITNVGKTYVCPLTAKATLGMEGEKSVVPYVYQQQ